MNYQISQREMYNRMVEAYQKCESDIIKHLGRELKDWESMYICLNFGFKSKEVYEHFGLEYEPKDN